MPFAPDHPPEAVHEVASVLLQVRSDELPETIEVGFAEIVAVGTGGGGGGGGGGGEGDASAMLKFVIQVSIGSSLRNPLLPEA